MENKRIQFMNNNFHASWKRNDWSVEKFFSYTYILGGVSRLYTTLNYETHQIVKQKN